MSDRSELALQLTDAVAAAYHAIERAGNRAYKSFGLSQRAHAAMQAVDLGGPDGARPSDVASELGVSRAAATTFIQRLEAKGFVETTAGVGHGADDPPTPGAQGEARTEVARGRALNPYTNVRNFMQYSPCKPAVFHTSRGACICG